MAVMPSLQNLGYRNNGDYCFEEEGWGGVMLLEFAMFRGEGKRGCGLGGGGCVGGYINKG